MHDNPPDIVFEAYDYRARKVYQAGQNQTLVNVRRFDRSVSSVLLLPRQRLIIPAQYDFLLRSRMPAQLPPLPPPASVPLLWPDLSTMSWPDGSYVYWPA